MTSNTYTLQPPYDFFFKLLIVYFPQVKEARLKDVQDSCLFSSVVFLPVLWGLSGSSADGFMRPHQLTAAGGCVTVSEGLDLNS